MARTPKTTPKTPADERPRESALVKFNPPTEWKPLSVELSRGPAWKFDEDGSVVIGIIRAGEVRDTTFEDRETGRSKDRRRFILSLDVLDEETGEVERRAVFLPEDYAKPITRHGVGKWIRIERVGEGKQTTYVLATS